MKQETDSEAAGIGNLVRRWFIYIAGIYILTLGLSLAIRAGIGISPQSSLTRTMTLVLPRFSQGTFNLTLEVIMLALTFFVMPRAFKVRNFLGLIPALILAVLLDTNLGLTGWIAVDSYPGKVVLLVFGDAMLAFGLFLMIRANLVLMPIDMFVNTIQKRTGRKWGNLKTLFDLTLLVTTAAIGFIFLGSPHFLREGTIINAICVGQYIKLYFFIAKKVSSRRDRSVVGAPASAPLSDAADVGDARG